MTTPTQKATLAGGCFWCLEAVYNQLQGVLAVTSGYTGGHTARPTYEQVCTGTTGHAEAVQVTFDPAVISYTDLLHVFFSIHDPTTLNRQDADAGTQYRSAIFCHDEQQERLARQVIADLQAQRLWKDPIVTAVSMLGEFYPAEDYHQEYFQRNPHQGYCRAVIAPKVAKFRQKYLDQLKK